MRTLTLYHGTLESLVPEILRTGLQPRGERPSHDAYMDSASMPPFLYLTSSFGIAVQHAVRISERVHQGAPISVVEVDSRVLKTALRYITHAKAKELRDRVLKETNQ